MTARPKTQSPPAVQPSMGLHEMLTRAQAHWNAGQADHAEQLCQRVLKEWPGQSDASHLLGLIAYAYANLDLAIDYLRRACKAPRAPAAYHSNLAEMCRQKGLLAEGETAGLRAVALEPNLATAWNNLGILQQEAGKFESSRIALERSVMLKPDWPEAHNNLGNTYRRLNDLTRARKHYERAIELRPDYAEGHSNLASLLNDRGEHDAAAAAARRAIEINPQLTDAYLNLAGIESARSQPAEALRWLNALLPFAPLHPGALSARARTLKQLDRLDEALEAARRAVTLAPQSAEAHNVLGQIHQSLAQQDEALAAFERAIELPGVCAEDAMLSRATVLMEGGRREAAELEYQRVAEAFPQSVKGLFGSAELKHFKASDPDIARLETFIQGGAGQPITDLTCAHFALGKAYLDADVPGQAFAHLDAGNRLKRSTFNYDPAATSAWLARIAEAFPASLFESLAGGGDPSAQPIFIIGMPRSGTTLIEQILASHSAVVGAGELPAMRLVADSVGPYPDFSSRLKADHLAPLGRRR